MCEPVSRWDKGKHWPGWCHVFTFLLCYPISLHIPILYWLILVISVEWNHNVQPSVISSHYSAGKALRHLLKPILLSHPCSTPDDILLVSSFFTLAHGSCHLRPSTCPFLQAIGRTSCEPCLRTTSVQTWVREKNGESKCMDGLTMRTTPMRYIIWRKSAIKLK